MRLRARPPLLTYSLTYLLSVNSYAPKVGIGKHVDSSCLGGFVGVASMGSGATILFIPEGCAGTLIPRSPTLRQMRHRCRSQRVLVKLWPADAGCHTYSFNSSKGSRLHCSTPSPQGHVTFPRLAHHRTCHGTANPLIPRSPVPLPPATFSKAFSPCPRVIKP